VLSQRLHNYQAKGAVQPWHELAEEVLDASELRPQRDGERRGRSDVAILDDVGQLRVACMTELRARVQGGESMFALMRRQEGSPHLVGAAGEEDLDGVRTGDFFANRFRTRRGPSCLAHLTQPHLELKHGTDMRNSDYAK
jgi:hypothetical protein